MDAVDVPSARAAHAFTRAISSERILDLAAGELRGATGADAVAFTFERDGGGLPAVVHPSVADLEGDTDAHPQRTWPIAGESTRGSVTLIFGASASDADVAAADDAAAAVAAELGPALDRARAVQRLARRERVEGAAAVAAGVAHELRNPLFGISSAAQLLRFSVHEDPVMEKNVGRILREVERLNALSAALLDYADVAPLHPAPVDPDDLWVDAIAAARGALESRALAVRHVPAEPRVVVDADAEQLAVVFGHVLTNAIEAAPEGTDLVLTATARDGVAWHARLHNDGPSIPVDALPRVFDLFFSTKPGRNGIGLALCQRIIHAHGGALALENAPAPHGGVDTTITLPRAGG